MIQTVSGIAARQGEVFPGGEPGPQFYPVSAIDFLTGYLMAFGAMVALARRAQEGGSWLVRISLAVNARIRDVSTAVVFQFCSAFGVWILAEQLHLSAIITLVVFAMIASRRAPEILPARMRIPAWAVWEVAVGPA